MNNSCEQKLSSHLLSNLNPPPPVETASCNVEGIFIVYSEEYMTDALSLLSGLKCKACRL